MDSSPPTDRPTVVEFASTYLGVEVQPWQRELLERLERGERLHFVGAWRGGGKTALLTELRKRALRRRRGPARVLPFRRREGT
jgi:hypothetical protein